MTKQASYLEKAIKLAVEEHAGELDKGGRPYILHLLRVMDKMSDDDLKTVAVLHDLIEDVEISDNQLLKRGIPQHLIEVLKILNRNQYKNYDEYIDHVKLDYRATLVKIADLEDNMDITRLNDFTADNCKRLKKYHQSWMKLKKSVQNKI